MTAAAVHSGFGGHFLLAAGYVESARSSLSNPMITIAHNWMAAASFLDVIAAVVLGGTRLAGGNGSVLRTTIGVLFLGVVNDGMNILNVPIDAQLMAKGVIIVGALGLAARRG